MQHHACKKHSLNHPFGSSLLPGCGETLHHHGIIMVERWVCSHQTHCLKLKWLMLVQKLLMFFYIQLHSLLNKPMSPGQQLILWPASSIKHDLPMHKSTDFRMDFLAAGSLIHSDEQNGNLCFIILSHQRHASSS